MSLPEYKERCEVLRFHPMFNTMVEVAESAGAALVKAVAAAAAAAARPQRQRLRRGVAAEAVVAPESGDCCAFCGGIMEEPSSPWMPSITFDSATATGAGAVLPPPSHQSI